MRFVGGQLTIDTGTILFLRTSNNAPRPPPTVRLHSSYVPVWHIPTLKMAAGQESL